MLLNDIPKLQKDAREIYDLLADSNWQKRVSGLQKIDVTDVSREDLVSLCPLLQKCCADLRSSLVKVAGDVVGHLAERYKDFEPLAKEFFLPALLKQTYKSIEVIATASHACVGRIVRACKFNKDIISVIVGGTKDKRNATLRHRCVEYVFIAIDTKPSKEMQPWRTVLERMMTETLIDAHPGVRRVSRQILMKYKKNWPERGDKFVKALSPRVQQSLKPKTPRKSSVSRPSIKDFISAKRAANKLASPKKPSTQPITNTTTIVTQKKRQQPLSSSPPQKDIVEIVTAPKRTPIKKKPENKEPEVKPTVVTPIKNKTENVAPDEPTDVNTSNDEPQEVKEEVKEEVKKEVKREVKKEEPTLKPALQPTRAPRFRKDRDASPTTRGVRDRSTESSHSRSSVNSFQDDVLDVVCDLAQTEAEMALYEQVQGLLLQIRGLTGENTALRDRNEQLQALVEKQARRLEALEGVISIAKEAKDRAESAAKA
mmetsp:Transcript_17608/g.19611  ORF Transcript_17608/g.19611 Transcript_17608/m.19611 type:complete len:485 (-) Transcript_17608:126-1580(-)